MTMAKDSTAAAAAGLYKSENAAARVVD